MFQTWRIKDIFTRMNFITSRRNTVDDVETTHTSPSHAVLQVSQYSTTRTIRALFYLRQGDYVFIGVCLFICLFAGRITEKLLNRFSQNLVERCYMGQIKKTMKKALRETQTLRAGCSKAESKKFAPPQTPFPRGGGAGPPKFNQLEMVTIFT